MSLHEQLLCDRCQPIRGDVAVWQQTVHCPLFTGEAKHQVVIASGSHLFPFRTEKLSPIAPMVLQCNAGE